MNDVAYKVPILLVDDRPENRLALQAVLSSPELNLIEACSGQEALDYLEVHECAVILLDVQMPVMDGFETARRIRANPSRASTPIIFITASLEDDTKIYQGYEAGAVDYILKPFEPLILKSKVKVFVELFRANKEVERQGELLRKQESHERDLFLEYALDAVVGMNREGKVNYWNPQSEIIFGWKKSEVLGRRMSEIIIPLRYQAAHEVGLKTFLQTGHGPILRKRIEISALKKDGTEFPVELTVMPIHSNGVITFSAFVRDISETKRIEHDRLDKQEKLSKALQARDEFISICSHELKTPLTSMKLQFQLASKQLEKNDSNVYTKEAVLRRIHSSNQQIDRMARLIEDMLDVARISSGKLLMKFKAVDFQDLVLAVLDRFQEQFRANGVSYTVSTLQYSPQVHGDSFRLEQVIANLLTNSIKYGERKPIHLSLKASRNSVRLDVEDHGLGIPPEHTELIFNRYERAIPSTNISGLGLGLYISRQIVMAHHGHISVRSELGKGSVFSVEFPILHAERELTGSM